MIKYEVFKMTLENKIKIKVNHSIPYYWLDYKPDSIQEEYLFNGNTLNSSSVNNNKVKKLISWCLG